MIYLDHAATSPLCDEARAAMEPYLTERFGNASEPHAAGRAAREGLQAARATIASLLGCAPAQVVFTSGGSEADNQAVFGLTGRPLGRIVVSAIEHPAVQGACPGAGAAGLRGGLGGGRFVRRGRPGRVRPGGATG